MQTTLRSKPINALSLKGRPSQIRQHINSRSGFRVTQFNFRCFLVLCLF